MSTGWIRFVLAGLLLLHSAAGRAQGEAYADTCAAECDQALAFWQTHATEFETAAGKAGVSARFLFAVVAPEVSQYARLIDKGQTYALKVLYARQGKAYADFSIGPFQMKPSFVERLEEWIRRDEALQEEFPEVLLPADSRDTRVMRLKRLESTEWQLAYLALFCRVVDHRFGALSFATEEEKLRFYSNAYNRGFHLDEKRLLAVEKACFPAFSRRKFQYADVSLWFYRQLP